jgi:GNAT superfamily N-acetyltransferase
MSEEVVLRSGDRVVLRPVQPADAPVLAAGFAALSAESRFRRFFEQLPELSAEQLAYLTTLDHHDHEAIGAICPDTGEGLGIARYVRSPTIRAEADVAVAVVDPWQRRGLATVLLIRLAERANAEGVRTFTGDVQAANEPVVELIRRLGVGTLTGTGPLLGLRVDVTSLLRS